MMLGKYSFGMGDRFGHQGRAQAGALIKAQQQGLDITPVWNKSHREHSIIGTQPADVRREADEAVVACGWQRPYFVDADHIGLTTVDAFLDASDFFTLDVADFIGRPAPQADIKAFFKQHRDLLGSHRIEGIDKPLLLEGPRLATIAGKYLTAVRQAGEIYRHIATAKGPDAFITEVSMDETETPQTPTDLLVILAALADEGVPLQTIAPKFSGRFNKGVDYAGDVRQFTRQLEQNLAVVRLAVGAFDLPANLKLSVHSGSDKFSVYGPIRRALQRFDAGLHLKTAGTTWLEELIGLALAGEDGLSLAKGVYSQAFRRREELCGPYATVIDIDAAKLPNPRDVQKWDGEQFATALRHDPSCPQYNRHFRQLLHVAYKIAAAMGPRFTAALERHAAVIAEHVTANLYDRHLCRLFLPNGVQSVL